MVQRFSRREALRLASLGGLALFHPPFLQACSSKEGGGAGGGDAGAPLGPVPFDPERSWWMQYNYAPVAAEEEHLELEVEGAIPPELDGLYVRNGSNPNHGDPGHWFLGQGMLHGVRLSGGKALWYRNRWVQTPLLDAVPSDAGVSGPPSGANTASNVSLIHHAGKLLSLGEVGFRFEISAEDLSTVGPYDFAGKLTTSMTAHPKVDPATGELLFFAYNFAAPFLSYHQVDAKGALVRTVGIDMPKSVMMHDFQITATRVVFMDLPISFSLELAVAGSQFPFKWDPANGARFGIFPRDGGPGDVKWIEVDTCFVFHTFNAYDGPNGTVVLEAVRYDELWVEGPYSFDRPGQVVRFTFDPAAGTGRYDVLDDRPMEFPQIDRRLQGKKHRYGYGVWLGEPDLEYRRLAGTRGLLKHDLQNGGTQALELAPAESPDEAFFVPASDTSGEDEGYLLSYVYDRRTDRTSLFILDAQDLEAGPVAKVKLPVRVPFGFHGDWVPAGA